MTDCEPGINDTPTPCDPNTDDSCPPTTCDPNTDDSCAPTPCDPNDVACW